MAHHAINLYFLNLVQLARFEELYHQWLFQKNQEIPDLKRTDMLSLQIIQLLSDVDKVS